MERIQEVSVEKSKMQPNVLTYVNLFKHALLKHHAFGFDNYYKYTIKNK